MSLFDYNEAVFVAAFERINAIENRMSENVLLGSRLDAIEKHLNIKTVPGDKYVVELVEDEI